MKTDIQNVKVKKSLGRRCEANIEAIKGPGSFIFMVLNLFLKSKLQQFQPWKPTSSTFSLILI